MKSGHFIAIYTTELLNVAHTTKQAVPSQFPLFMFLKLMKCTAEFQHEEVQRQINNSIET